MKKITVWLLCVLSLLASLPAVHAEEILPLSLDPWPGYRAGLTYAPLGGIGYHGVEGDEYLDIKGQSYFRTITEEGYGDWQLFQGGETYRALRMLYDMEKGFDSVGQPWDWQAAYCIERGVTLNDAYQPEAETVEESPFMQRLQKINPEGWLGMQVTALYGCSVEGELPGDAYYYRIQVLNPIAEKDPSFPIATTGYYWVDWYVATNMIYWEFQMGLRDRNGYVDASVTGCPGSPDMLYKEIEGTAAGKVYQWMSQKITEHFQTPSFAGESEEKAPTYSLQWNDERGRYEIQLTDTTGMSWHLVEKAEEDLHIEGLGDGKYLIWTTEEQDGVLHSIQKEVPVLSEEAKPVFIWNSGENLQTMLTGTGESDPVYFYFRTSTEKPEGSIRGSKVDENGKGLAGATISLYQNGQEIGQMVTGEDGSWHFTGLPSGNYEIVESHAPEGYVGEEKKIEVSLTVSERNVVLEPIVNQRIYGNVRLRKTDGTIPLRGAQFTLFYEDGTAYGVFKEKEDGIYELTDIPYGKYYVQETAGLPFYEMGTEKFPVSIEQSDVWVDLGDIVNLPKTGTVTIHKVDATEEEKTLNGCMLKLEKWIEGHWKEVGVGSSNEEGEVVFSNLTCGSYRLTEIKAPAGYQLLSQPIAFALPYSSDEKWEEDLSVELTIGNLPIYDIPHTGGVGIIWYLLGSIVCLVIGSIWIYRYGNQKEVKD